MGLFCRAGIEAAEIESMKAPVEKWREIESRTDLTEDLSESTDGKDENEDEPGDGDFGIGVCSDGDWVGYVVVGVFGCPSEANAVQEAVKSAFRRNKIGESNLGELLEHII